MGFIATRPNGKTKRNRRQSVAVLAHRLTSADRGKDDAVVAEIKVRAASGECYDLCMTQEELDQLVINLAPVSNIKARLEIAAASLHALNDSQLLSLICEVLHGREKPSGVLKP